MESSNTDKRPTTQIPVVLDKEIDKIVNDAFGHRHFAVALASLVECTNHVPPYSVGLLGSWGTGKSSVKQMYLTELRNDVIRNKAVKAVTFNAWRYGGAGDIRRALLRDIFCELGGDESAILEKLFNQMQRREKEPRKLRELFQEFFYEKVLWTLLQFVLLAALIVVASKLAAFLLGLSQENSLIWTLGAFTLLVGLGAKYLLNPEKLFTARYTDVTKVEQPHASAEQFEKLLRDQLREYKKRNKDCTRLVIFVDDLDRLSSEEMVAGLDAIRTLMDIAPNSDGVGILFVISCDESRVAEALSKRSSRAGTDMPGAITTQYDARRYLDRIFQFRLDIPPLPRQDMRGYIANKLNEPEFLQIRTFIDNAGVALDDLVSKMIHVGVQSPRNAVQILNAFSQAYWIAIKREFEGTTASAPGALTEGVVTRHPLTLAIVSVLKVDFPDFYDQVQRDPALLSGFIHTFVNHGSPESLPATTKKCLRSYRKTQEDEDEWQLDEKHSRLRQFLASVATVALPESLQPFILLNQDEVSRRTGDAGSRLYAPMISGDFDGVMQLLGHDQHDRPLTDVEGRLLLEVWNTCQEESGDRAGNAAYVLAKLLGIATGATARSIAKALVLPIRASKPLRIRCGAKLLLRLAEKLAGGDRKIVSSHLYNEWLLSTEEAYAQVDGAEGTSVASVVAEQAFKDWSNGSVDDDLGQRLIDWSVERNIKVGGESGGSTVTLPFSELQHWIDLIGDKLLDSIGDKYVEVGIAEIESEGFDVSLFIVRCRRIMAKLISTPDQVETFWSLVKQLCAALESNANQFGQELIKEHQAKATPAQLDTILSVLSERVAKYANEEKPYAEDREAVSLISSICKTPKATIKSSASNIAKAATALADNAELVAESCCLAQCLVDLKSDRAPVLLGEWVQKLSSDLAPDCATFVGRYANLLQEESIAEVIEYMDQALESPSDESATAYNALWKGAHASPAASLALESHIVNMLGSIKAQATTLSVLKEHFPGISKALSVTSNVSEVGAAMEAAMIRALADPTSCGLFFQLLSTWGPTAISNYAPLSVNNIVQRAADFLENNPTLKVCRQVMQSIEVLVAKEAPAEGTLENFLIAIGKTWKYHRQDALRVLTANSASLLDETIVSVAEQVTADAAVYDGLAELLGSFATTIEAERASSITKRLLAIEQLSLGGERDAVLRAWFSSLAQQMRLDQIQLISDPELNTGQTGRIWEQLVLEVAGAGTGWSLEFLVASLKQFPGSDKPATVFTLIYESKLAESEKKNIVAFLLDQITLQSRVDEKKSIAKWIKQFNGGGAVTDFVKAGRLNSGDDLEILLGEFPGNRTLKKALSKMD